MPFWPVRVVTLPIPPEAQEVLDQVPAVFTDDGCSNSPDRILRFEFRWVCRIHDWRGCTRCWPAGSRTLDEMFAGNEEIWRHMGVALPLRYRWARWIYYAILARFNGDVAWDSCGPNPREASDEQLALGQCRHSMPMPDWMRPPRPPEQPEI